ncbi:MAG: DUF6340 family protein [Candidatus Azobacteroides sp.]|nr:DUF6340 family protein [Candidatus Azobacteroides sp.]
MRKITNIYGIGLTAVMSLTSCLSTQQFTIEVQEPAQVTFPTDIRNVLVVNNIAKQPWDEGITRVYNGRGVEGFDLNMDSIAWITVAAATDKMLSSHFFDQVLWYKEPVREDSDWLTVGALDPAFRNSVFQEQNLDGIISINRMPFKGRVDVRNDMPNQEGLTSAHFVDIQLNAALTSSIYLYNRESPLTTFTLIDSLSFQGTFFSIDKTVFLKEIPESFLNELAYRLGEKLAAYLFPSWVQKKRTIYAGYDSRMQEALSFMRNKKWSKAEAIWINEYDHNSQPLSKGRQANNIAVANEMQDRLDLALQWALTAEELFKENNRSSDSNEKTWIGAYIAELQKRMQDNQLLNIQLGIEAPE